MRGLYGGRRIERGNVRRVESRIDHRWIVDVLVDLHHVDGTRSDVHCVRCVECCCVAYNWIGGFGYGY